MQTQRPRVSHFSRQLLRSAAIPASLMLCLSLVGCQAPVRQGWLGLSTDFAPPMAYRHQQVTARTAADRDLDMEILREMEVPLIRDVGMSWAVAQPTVDSKYNFDASDELVQRAQALRAELLVVCTGVPTWAAASAGEGGISFSVPHRDHVQAFEQFVRAYVQRYSPRGGVQPPIHAIEFMQDIERIPTAEYAFWLKRLYITVKSVDPSIQVVLGGLYSPGVSIPEDPHGDYATYFERLLAESELAGERYPYFDVVAFHNFPRRYPGREAFSDAFAYLQKCKSDRSIRLPIWVTAFGSSSEGDQEAAQAADIVKSAIHGRAIGIERLYLYNFRDYPAAPNSEWGQFGLLRAPEPDKPPMRKLACQAFATLLHRLDKQPAITARSQGVYMLTGQGDPTYALWQVETYDQASFVLPGWWEVQALSGVRAIRQGTEVKLSLTPIFIQKGKSPFIY